MLLVVLLWLNIKYMIKYFRLSGEESVWKLCFVVSGIHQAFKPFSHFSDCRCKEVSVSSYFFQHISLLLDWHNLLSLEELLREMGLCHVTFTPGESRSTFVWPTLKRLFLFFFFLFEVAFQLFWSCVLSCSRQLRMVKPTILTKKMHFGEFLFFSSPTELNAVWSNFCNTNIHFLQGYFFEGWPSSNSPNQSKRLRW